MVLARDPRAPVLDKGALEEGSMWSGHSMGERAYWLVSEVCHSGLEHGATDAQKRCVWLGAVTPGVIL